MKIAKAGAMDAFLEILPQRAKALPILPSLCLTLKSLAVNVSHLCPPTTGHVLCLKNSLKRYCTFLKDLMTMWYDEELCLRQHGCFQDEICRDFAEEGGLSMVLEILDYASKYPNKIVGRTSCALLSQVSCL